MAARRTTFGKMERDRAKKAKAAAKRERREERQAAPDDDLPEEETATSGPTMPEDEVLERLKTLHERFDDGQISFDDFEKQKTALLSNLGVD